MAKRTKRAARTKKQKTTKKKVANKISEAFANKKAINPNARARLKAFRALEDKINTAWAKLKKDVKSKNVRAVLADREHLKLLLGECNYMANQCKRHMHETKRSRRSHR